MHKRVFSYVLQPTFGRYAPSGSGQAKPTPDDQTGRLVGDHGLTGGSSTDNCSKYSMSNRVHSWFIPNSHLLRADVPQNMYRIGIIVRIEPQLLGIIFLGVYLVPIKRIECNSW